MIKWDGKIGTIFWVTLPDKKNTEEKPLSETGITFES